MWTQYINERAIATSLTVNKQSVLLMSTYFHHSEYADHHVERAYNSIHKLTKSRRSVQIVGTYFNAELGHGIGDERIGVDLKYSRDAEANDMIHLGSDHRSVMAQLVIPAPTKERHPKRKPLMWRRKSATDDNNDQVSESAKSEKNIKFEKRYSELERRSMQKPKG